MNSIELQDYLKNNILLTDGAMNTYYNEISEFNFPNCEVANIYDENTIVKIHNEYINAGSQLIRTNTFAANTRVLETGMTDVKNIIRSGYNIAKNIANKKNVFIGASIGPIPDNSSENCIYNEYIEIVDIFLNMGADIFIFETFSSLDYLLDISKYIKSKKPSSFILTQFALTDTGVTKKAVSFERIINKLNLYNYIDAFGFNCGMGPMHMTNIFKKSPYICKYISALPNAGYPEIIENKTKFMMNPQYFADMSFDMLKLGVKILGGCCGTTPLHIELLSKKIKESDFSTQKKEFVEIDKKSVIPNRKKIPFHSKLERNKFTIAVEFDPPFKTSVDNIIEGVKQLKKHHVDIITIADSPMGKTRADSIVVSAKIKRETGIDTLPHICCRDKNSIALRSSILGAYIEDIRNILVVTGDPIPEEIKNETKSVFNLNSYSLIKMIDEMNKDVFIQEPIKIGGAVNFNVKNKNLEYERMLNKVKAGANFFLTQPIFTDDVADFLSGLDINREYRILGGIMPLVTYNNAQFINNELPGINIPQEYCDKFSPDMTREEAEDVGVEIAVELAKKIVGFVDGFYFITPFNRYEMIMRILKRLNL